MGGFDIYIATRPSRDDPWGAPALLDGVNTHHERQHRPLPRAAAAVT